VLKKERKERKKERKKKGEKNIHKISITLSEKCPLKPTKVKT
jgi:hypothetical protein